MDLWERGDDLHDYFRGRKPWRRLRNIISRLPQMGSHYGASVRNDPDVAAMVAELLADDRKWSPAAADWSLHMELTAQLIDAAGVLATLLADLPTAVKKRSRPPRPVPRPITEVEKARRRAEARLESDLDALITAAHAEYEAEQRRG